MTREESINNAAVRFATQFIDTGETDFYGHFVKEQGLDHAEYRGFIAGAKWADVNPKSTWISVEDDLPCNHKELMVKDEKGRWETKRVLVRIQETDISSRSPYFADCMMSKWDGEENGFLWHLCSQGYITHWMPIPELED